MTPFHYRDNQLFCEDTPLHEIVTQVGTPVYVYSKTEIRRRASAYLDAASLAGSKARILAGYAIKANGNPALIRTIVECGLGADVTSGGELFLARHAGAPPQEIIFSGVGKTRLEIEMALDAGIRALHVESEMELAALADIAAARRQVARIGVRVNPNINAETHPYISTGLHAHKFGVPRVQAVTLLRQAAAHPWLEPVGLAAHIGSQITDLQPFVESAQFLAALAEELADQGIRLTYIDVGGGLGINYTKAQNLAYDNREMPPSPVPAIQEWVTAVSRPIIEAGYEMLMEPGRSIVGPAGILLTQIVYTKKQGEKQFVIVDAGMNDLIRPTLYQAYHPIVPVCRSAEGSHLTSVNIVGPVCESGDFLAKERPFPQVKPGDLLAVLQAGAYGFAMSSNYNGRLRAAEVLVNKDQFQVIRRRQQYEHLLDGCSPH